MYFEKEDFDYTSGTEFIRDKTLSLQHEVDKEFENVNLILIADTVNCFYHDLFPKDLDYHLKYDNVEREEIKDFLEGSDVFKFGGMNYNSKHDQWNFSFAYDSIRVDFIYDEKVKYFEDIDNEFDKLRAGVEPDVELNGNVGLQLKPKKKFFGSEFNKEIMKSKFGYPKLNINNDVEAVLKFFRKIAVGSLKMSEYIKSGVLEKSSITKKIETQTFIEKSRIVEKILYEIENIYNLRINRRFESACKDFLDFCFEFGVIQNLFGIDQNSIGEKLSKSDKEIQNKRSVQSFLKNNVL